MLLPLGHWPHGRGTAHKLQIAALCGGLSQIQTDSFLSLNSWTIVEVFELCKPAADPGNFSVDLISLPLGVTNFYKSSLMTASVVISQLHNMYCADKT